MRVIFLFSESIKYMLDFIFHHVTIHTPKSTISIKNYITHDTLISDTHKLAIKLGSKYSE